MEKIQIKICRKFSFKSVNIQLNEIRIVSTTYLRAFEVFRTWIWNLFENIFWKTELNEIEKTSGHLLAPQVNWLYLTWHLNW